MVFVILLTFSSMEECWHYADNHNIEGAMYMCDKFEKPLAPITSLRPKARPTDD